MMGMIYGGSGSGKSELAEALLTESAGKGAPLVYLATMRPGGPDDSDAQARIARHQAMRARKGFATVERPVDLASASVAPGSAILLECLGTLLANEMFPPEGQGRIEDRAQTARLAVLRGLDALAQSAERLLVVSNDVFSDGAEHTPETGAYCRVLAELNATVARRSHLVAEVVCGIPLWHKRDEAWYS